MIQIPKLFQNRIVKIVKDYEIKINQINEKYKAKSEHYYNKLVEIKNEMEKLYDDESISAVTKGEKFVQLTSTFEKYVDKYEEPRHKISELTKDFEKEIIKIVEMIHQHKPDETIKDINDAVIKYIIKNSE